MRFFNIVTMILNNKVDYKIPIVPHTFNINYKTYVDRRIMMYQNIQIPKEINCPFCKGTGFVECRKCKQPKIGFIPSPNSGCWRCSDSTLEICPFCGGCGKGQLCYNEITN